MIIDEEKQYILTNYQNVNKGGKAVDSDHFTQFMDLDLQFESEKPQRVEIYNFKEKLTSETDELSNCFADETSLLQQVKSWRGKLENFCKKSFTKIRIRKKSIKPLKETISSLIDERNQLSRNEVENEEKIAVLNHLIADEEATENRNIIMDNFKDLSENPENVN